MGETAETRVEAKAYQPVLSRWCAERVPAAARHSRQVAYTIHEGVVTIVDRRPPTFPELTSAWTRTPIAQLRLDTEGQWHAYRRAGDRWEPYAPHPTGPLEDLLTEIAADPRFWR
ncbi:DUF3024 domain-containing protein [Pseudonocardia eucalypti]|uniref:DUF3024 domain-containing protein n=1 Tax=Pseudonocardia eucalypti TaxID=648755 RepID=A0ABP9PEE3_9PSEU|nr:hypothetical protein [Pseudonocardia eucalypti]